MALISDETVERAKAAKTVEEFLAVAEDVDVEMSREEAEMYFAMLHPELVDKK